MLNLDARARVAAKSEKHVMFRNVELPEGVRGDLFLHSMPGRYEPFPQAAEEIGRCEIDRVVSLAPADEIMHRSSEYARALAADELPCAYDAYPIPDFGVPLDRDDFAAFVYVLATRLRAGERMLVHCGAGIGRTGVLACCLLIALGVSQENALKTVHAAGSGPETPEQKDLIDWFAHEADGCLKH